MRLTEKEFERLYKSLEYHFDHDISVKKKERENERTDFMDIYCETCSHNVCCIKYTKNELIEHERCKIEIQTNSSKDNSISFAMVTSIIIKCTDCNEIIEEYN